MGTLEGENAKLERQRDQQLIEPGREFRDMPPEQCLEIVRSMCDALQTAGRRSR